MSLVRVLSVALLVTVAGCGAPAVPQALQYATVSGRVYNTTTNAAVAGVTVTINGIQSAMSDGNGAYKITNVPNGPVDWFADGSPLYGQASGSLTLPPGQSYTLNIPLTHV